MAIAPSSIEWRYSGGAANTDPNACLGGAISTAGAGTVDDAIKNDLLDDVLAAEALSGDVEYRGFYIKNADATQTATDARIYISQATSSASDELDIGLAVEGVSTSMATIANEGTAPTSVVFSRPTTNAAGLQLNSSTGLAAGQYKGVWVRRTVSAAATSAAVTAQLAVEYDTV